MAFRKDSRLSADSTEFEELSLDDMSQVAGGFGGGGGRGWFTDMDDSSSSFGGGGGRGWNTKTGGSSL